MGKKNKSVLEYATVEAVCRGVPVYSFDNLIYVYGESPDFYKITGLQDGSAHKPEKIKLKKVWEITNNFVGVCHEMTPRTRLNDSQPYLPIHLIDGDPETIWASFECFAPDARPEWIRLDLPSEKTVTTVELHCNKKYMGKDYGSAYRPQWHFGDALPKDLSVAVSRDAWHWDTVFSCEGMPVYEPADGESMPGAEIRSACPRARGFYIGTQDDPEGLRIEFEEPVAAKQVLITANDFVKTGYEGYMFSISGVGVFDAEGANVALVSMGTGVTVSSVSDAHYTDRRAANSLWGPLQYDLGNKWTKAGSDNGSPMWCFTEHEKGVLRIDEGFDRAAAEAVENGMKLILTLDFKGNWIYENPPKKTVWNEARYREINDSYLGGVAAVDDNPEMFEGYLRYVRYMAGHFKGRAEYFEIGNEWNGGWNDNLDRYKNVFFEPAYDVIKEAAPGAKIMLCSTAGFLEEEILRCISPGICVKDGKMEVHGRMLAIAKGVSGSGYSLCAEVSCGVATGFIFGFNAGWSANGGILAAVYDPTSKTAYFLEEENVYIMETGIFSRLARRNETHADAGFEIRMKAEIKGGVLSFEVADLNGGERFTARYEPKQAPAGGGAGLIQSSRNGMCGYSNFTAVDPSGNVLFSDGFSDLHASRENWKLYLNHWDDGTKPAAARRVDAIGWHPGDFPGKNYFDKVRNFREECREAGFAGEFFCNEVYAGAAYPPGPAPDNSNQFRLSDMREAKYLARSIAGHGCLNIEAGPCHVHFTGFPHPQALCRTTAPSQAAVPVQPKPSYYALRNIATISDGFYEADFPVLVNGETVLAFTCKNGDGKIMICAWADVNLTDENYSVKTDFTLPDVRRANAVAYDSMNGISQRFETRESNGGTYIAGVHVRDYPVYIILDADKTV